MTALPFGLLSLYAIVAVVSIFYKKSMQKIGVEVLAEIRLLRQKGQHEQAKRYIQKVRNNHFKIILFVIICIIAIGSSAVSLLAYQAGIKLYEDIK